MSSIGLIFPDQLSLNNEVLEVIQGDDQFLHELNYHVLIIF